MLLACGIWGLMAPLGKDAMSNGVGGLEMVTFRVRQERGGQAEGHVEVLLCCDAWHRVQPVLLHHRLEHYLSRECKYHDNGDAYYHDGFGGHLSS